MRPGLLLLLLLLPSLCGAQMRALLPNAPPEQQNGTVDGARKRVSTEAAAAQTVGEPRGLDDSGEAAAPKPGLWSYALHHFWSAVQFINPL